MTEWPTVELGEVVDFLTGFPFKSASYSNDPTDIRLLRGDNIAQGTLRWENAKRWASTIDSSLEAYALQRDDVVLAMDRPWIEAGLKYANVTKGDLPSLLVQRVTRLRGTTRLSTRFLRYVIGSKSFTDHVLGIQTGTAVPHISGAQIKAYKFRLPPRQIQDRAVEILTSLDDRIELSRRMNETLEAMAQAIFRDWFVDFGPTRRKLEGATDPITIMSGLVQDAERAQALADLFPATLGDEGLPEEWETKPIGELTEIVGGSTPSTSEASFWADGRHAWATPKDLSNIDGLILFETERRISDAGLKKITSGLSPEGTVLLSSRAPIGYLAVAATKVAVNQGFIAIRPSNCLPTAYSLFWCKENMDLIKAHANGSTFQEISKRNFLPLPVVVPTSRVLDGFIDFVQPIFEQIELNLRSVRTLSKTRDLLLPKLMSGEVRLTSTEQMEGDGV